MIPTERHHLAPFAAAPRIIAREAGVLAVDKPIGWLTHPDGAAGRPDVVTALGEALGVHQRLDVDTSGVLLFSTDPAAAKRLAAGWGRASKRYVAVVDGRLEPREGTWRDPVDGRAAETRYAVRRRGAGWSLLDVWPVTGRTHQIRVHCAGAGHPIRGDMIHGDPLDVRAPRTLLHCAAIEVDGLRFEAPLPAPFARYTGEGDPRAALAADPATTCYRWLAGADDGHPGWVVDRYADWAWVLADGGEGPLPAGARGVFRIDTVPDRSRNQQGGPRLVRGEAAPEPLEVIEEGVRYHAILGGHLSTGLFLDQRPQRGWLSRNAGGMRVLNTFAHAGGFSVAAAVAGAQTVSIDLSRAWLDRIPPMLAANGIDPAGHDRIFGDVFDWVRRLANRGEQFDLVILDPPSTSVGKKKRRWSAARDYPELVQLAAPLVAPGGRLWAATNHRQISPRRFAAMVGGALGEGARLERICPPAVDFPTDGPAPVKTHVWRVPS